MENLILKNILDNIDLPIALFQQSGEIYYQNENFKKLNLDNYDDLESKFDKVFSLKKIEIKNNIYLLVSIHSDLKIQQDFLSTVSHELRTPLTSIRGFADTMLASSSLLSKEQNNKFLYIIRNQADRLTRLVENLLEVSKISQKSKLILKEINLKNFLSMLMPIFEKKYSNCVYDVDIPQNFPMILSDSDLLEQIMTNLIDNASKYSLGNPIIKVKVFLENNFVKISIFDEAEKIPQNQFDKIFNKFSRIDSPLTRKVDGSGLGLYITKALISKLNGKITVDNYEKGNVFSIYIPVYSVEQHLNSKIIGE